MIRGPAGRCRIDAIEPEIAEFQRIDEHIHRANRIALVDPIIKAFRQQRRLLAIRPLNKALHHPPAIQQGNHSIVGVFTQPGPTTDILFGQKVVTALLISYFFSSARLGGSNLGSRSSTPATRPSLSRSILASTKIESRIGGSVRSSKLKYQAEAMASYDQEPDPLNIAYS